MRSKILRAGRDLALLGLGLALIGLPAVRAAGPEPDCSEAVENEIRDELCQGGLVGLAIQPSDAEALLCMPPPVAWNGDLIVFARGNTLFPDDDCKLAAIVPQLDVDTTRLPQLANELGFGFAATTCSEDFIALEECKADVVDLAENFQVFLDELEAQNGGGVDYGVFEGQTFITGASFGGLVATQLIEEQDLTLVATENGSDLFVGGLSACAPIGSFAALIRYQGDVLTLVDCLYRDEWAALGLTEGLFFPNAERKPVVDPAIPLDDLNDFAGFCRQAEETIDDDPGRAEQLVRIMAASGQRVATDPSGETTVGESVAELLCDNALPAIPRFEDRFGGNPYDNLRRFYVDPESGLLANLALNRCVDRFAANVRPEAFETSGRVGEPLVGLHTVDDPGVPFSQLLRYELKVLQQGTFANFTPIPDTNFGHCAFDRETILLALAVLFFQVQGFDLPGVAALLEDAEARRRFDERLARLR
jgi:hypothetical protein